MFFADSFGGGMGAGMGAGIGCGIAIGIPAGQKKAAEKLREHFAENGLTVHDRMGKEVDLETVLATVSTKECSSSSGWAVALALVILGLIFFAGLLTYFALF